MATQIFSTASKKEKETEKPFVTINESILGNYKLTIALVGNVNVFDNSVPLKNVFESCHKDDIHQFNSDLTYKIVDVGETCSPTSADNSVWEFVNTTKMKVDGEQATIASLDGKKLVLTHENPRFSTAITFTKQ